MADNGVDITGTGDAFHGGFIYSVLNDFGLEESGRFANACSGICCNKVGARSIGGLPDVKSLIKIGERVNYTNN
jgi:sugar/nucleoside kinase (ribokinase family)